MPIYEYRCMKCDHTFEMLMRLKDPKPACPSCGSGKTEKLMSCAAIRPEGVPRGSGGFAPPSCGGGGGG
ncbi:FmdB family zinc ribbon protein [Desulfobotulus mexicanus]|uniref:Zinc ribbon domain-containing protein n=1 Tax=Desulfobotulus mexicanus TaxID=2586642 RepID=A0A5S5ME86_9BACT|nr:zinc ribbon domain-containing protein [Desulfobotulus mexicanus]TYT73945.1 zinc ribbon domain-containing protein [Desulfobotulus mexicanus]